MNALIQNILFLTLALACAGAAHVYFSVAEEYALIPIYLLATLYFVNILRKRPGRAKVGDSTEEREE